jgi:hypothetical protein
MKVNKCTCYNSLADSSVSKMTRYRLEKGSIPSNCPEIIILYRVRTGKFTSGLKWLGGLRRSLISAAKGRICRGITPRPPYFEQNTDEVND